MSASTGVHLCFFMARTRCPAGKGRGGEERQGSGKGLGGVGSVHGHAAESGYCHAS